MNGTANDKKPSTSMAATVDQDHWPLEDILILLETMKSILPSQESKHFQTTQSKLDWNKLAFKNYTGPMCSQKWAEISKEVRKFRTLSELILEAEDLVKKNLTVSSAITVQKHLQLPKKPLTAYFRFFLEKRAQYAKRYPKMNSVDLTKKLSYKFRQLPKEKKMKYSEDFQREKQEFNSKMATLREKQLELQQKTDIHEKSKTPQQLWYSHKSKQYLKKNPEASAKDVKDALEQQWHQLSEEKRLKWTRKALEQPNKYEECIQKDPEENISEEVIPPCSLTKAKRQLRDELDRPLKTFSNCYSMYCSEVMANMKDVPNKERFGLCSRGWKLLSQKDKDAYYERFKQSLVNKEQRRVLAEEKTVSLDKKESRSSKQAKSKSSQLEKEETDDDQKKLPKMPKTAEEIWQESVIGDYLDRFKNDQAKALMCMRSTWMEMGKEEKIVWIKKAAKDQKRYARELRDMGADADAASPAKKIRIEDEPKKSPKSTRIKHNATPGAKSANKRKSMKEKAAADEIDENKGIR